MYLNLFDSSIMIWPIISQMTLQSHLLSKTRDESTISISIGFCNKPERKIQKEMNQAWRKKNQQKPNEKHFTMNGQNVIKNAEA